MNKNTNTKPIPSKYNKLKSLSPAQFRRVTGVTVSAFQKMLVVVRRAEKAVRKRGGRLPNLCLEDQLLLTLEYLREYRTYLHIGLSYGVSESTAQRISQWVEDVLIKDKQFALPGKKALLKSDVSIEVVLVDAAESPVERPQKKQKQFYSGKKKHHTLKSQVAVNKQTKKILCTDFTQGKTHDFRLFKESKVSFQPGTQAKTDSGYQGIQNLHANSEHPKKKRKKHPLTKEEKRANRAISSQRMTVEHVIGAVKRFKIISERYRNRRKRFGLRFNLIAGIYNLQVG